MFPLRKYGAQIIINTAKAERYSGRALYKMLNIVQINVPIENGFRLFAFSAQNRTNYTKKRRKDC